MAFERIREMTGEEDLDLLVNRFIEVEDRNFALFNFVNEQNNEIEKLNDEIKDVSLACFGFYMFCNSLYHSISSYYKNSG